MPQHLGDAMQTIDRIILTAQAAGEVIAFDEGISFWGGVDPDTGRVIDAHHPAHGEGLAGRIVLMPTSRGSCSGSGVLLQLALSGHAPAALVFREAEEVLTLGALIAARMFDRPLAVLRLSAASYAALAGESHAEIAGDRLRAGTLDLPLMPVTPGDLALDAGDLARSEGAAGRAVQLAQEVLGTMAAVQGATRLIDVTRGHIDGCILAHDANLIFAEAMAEMGAQVAIPTTINAISVDRQGWRDRGVPPVFGNKASRLADAYVRMGVAPTFTCAPYQGVSVPAQGEVIGWSESNAVIYANSVLGARTAKHPDYLDLFIAMTGRAPETGVYLDANRVAEVVIEVDAPDGADDALWPLLGWLAGRLAPDRVPVLQGVAGLSPSPDDLRAVCAAFGTTSASALLHVAGVTPEGDAPPRPGAPVLQITRGDIAAAWAEFNQGPEAVELIAIGSPHAALSELRAFDAALAGRSCAPGVAAILTVGRDVLEGARADGLLARLEGAGVQVIPDLCWCSITEPVFPPGARTLMTNSGKYAHYAPGLSARAVRFGGIAACAEAAVTGRAQAAPPVWLA
ncbi:aconitase X [Roseicyclus mahoneyensis]|uniref:Putative aconitase subunit 1 n=1 Tax=Roseicyclus mahoneyensis TaxID=164332 RepID=A0A316GIT7_9RHOB|nr:aconitase family protein [Roseicyclus mahoneyensis]PWK60882.1 putative aconitase subunit 1 [Roseicyclus mahoneyensis]